MSWADRTERNRPAVEAIASDSEGRTLAVEHTLVQPFVGEKEDTTRFLEVLAPLDKDPTLRIPGHMIDVLLRAGGIPTGVIWSELVAPVREWLQQNLPAVPDGSSVFTISTHGVELELTVQKRRFDSVEGLFFVSRILPPESLQEVVRNAVTRKLPKLAAASTDARILLFEKDQSVESPVSIREALDAVAEDFPLLSRVDEIWVAITSCWETDNVLWFYEIVPDLGGRRYKVECAP